MISKCSKIVSVLIVLALLTITTAPAGAYPFSMYGGIFDEAGHPIPMVNLTITSNSTPDNVTIEYVTYDNGYFNGSGFEVWDLRDNKSATGPSPLALIWANGQGDIITVTAEKDGYETQVHRFEVGGDRIYFNMTMKKDTALSESSQSLLLLGGIAVIAIIAIGLFIFFDRKNKVKVSKPKDRKRRRRR